MARRIRLDAELVRRRLVSSRERAVEAIAAGRVRVGGVTATKPATVVDGATSIVLAVDDDPGYASRGAHKLVGAFEAFGVPAPGTPGLSGGPGQPDVPARPGSPAAVAGPPALVVAGRRCLDAGASTGGFTDVLLRYGAARVVAVDVGYGQLVWRLRSDPRVRVLDRTNVRNLTPEQVGEPVELVVGDLSFISLVLVLPALRACAAPDADFVLLVKPQFEVGRELLGSGGVVRDVALHARAVRTVVTAAEGLGLGARGVAASPLPGPAGNVEYLAWLRADVRPTSGEVEAMITAAIEAGPASTAAPAPAPPPSSQDAGQDARADGERTGR
ncbi:MULTISPECIES: TlyA family RNA methyltransferase [Parafrankia]|uniref:Hemolysin n=1 Tax=Parafrankia soli TaxID=2599596 RepID=A0A1S1PQV2_9ACTN|nr:MULTISPECIES: TlyA family RNA methyltransferase [Parafrankia]OHV25153.1 hemolysin [Parafrankia soli]TCJ33552.1 TlyA family RNA methyltransferase [Parafrankia sp. BMG5.11]CAI7978261.1 16S/23S rRNA (cytidine-2'-O)-methyltransferase TlyA [Frankia sp. Hr75.2]SQD96959.1 16S/23S rRNA (cytidine-2'-O)-methyltransferase TlyA [Parafrankia sp. Ea1.12]